jgi:hypothetical protein
MSDAVNRLRHQENPQPGIALIKLELVAFDPGHVGRGQCRVGLAVVIQVAIEIDDGGWFGGVIWLL